MSSPPEKYDTKADEAEMVSDGGRTALSAIGSPEDIRTLESELESTRAELAAATDRYRQIFDKAPVGYVLLDASGRIQEGNAELGRMLGVAPADLAGAAFSDFVAPADRQELAAVLNCRADPVSGRGLVVMLEPPGKEAFYARVECRSARIPTGCQSSKDPSEAFLVAVSDVSEQKDIEAAVIHAKQEWEQTFDAVLDPMALIDDQSRVVRVNRALADRLGVSPRECLGKRCYELIHGDSQRPADCPHSNRFENGRSHYQLERFEPRLDGYFVTTVTPFNKPGSDQQWSVHVFHDITRRREMEEALRIREGRFRAFAENTADVTTIISQGIFRYLSPAIRGMLDIHADELVNRSPELVIHPEDWPSHARHLEHAIQMPGVSLMLPEVRFRHRDGQWVSMDAKATYMPDTPGVEGLVVVYRDITEKKQMAFQLQQSLKLESIGRLAGGVAHEFNNILGIIIGNTELALDDLPEGSTGKLFLKEIQAAGFRAREVVRQLLKFSRRTPAERKPISIAPLITETLRLMRASIPTRIEIKSRIPVPHETISADPTQIRQVLVHLCNNAFQAMEAKGGRLEITVENVTLNAATVGARFPDLEPGRYVELTVKDSGHGIAPEMLDHIFDPYFSTRDIGKSSGMGLAVAQGIVKSHDGAITVESAPGEGSVFRVYLPVVRSQAVTERAVETPSPGRGEHILLVDDESVLLRTVKLMLERLGYQVEAFQNPLEALAQFTATPDRFDLVMTDLTMPEMDGQILAKKLLAIRPSLPIIICSGYTDRIAAETLEHLKTARALSKPVDGKGLATALRSALNGEK